MANENETYAVVRHSAGVGYVVRAVHGGWLPAPYTQAARIREYRRRADAERMADKLNRAEGVY